MQPDHTRGLSLASAALILAALAGQNGLATAAPPAAASAVVPIHPADIKVSIGIGQYGEATFDTVRPRTIRADERASDLAIPVYIENISNRPLDIFTPGTSWGDATISLVATTPDGKSRTFRMGGAGYSANAPVFVRLEPGEITERAIPYQLKFWSELHDFLNSLKNQHDNSIKIRVVVQQIPMKMKDKNLWTGTAESPEVQVNVVPW